MTVGAGKPRASFRNHLHTVIEPIEYRAQTADAGR
jgi:hypothetical protein